MTVSFEQVKYANNPCTFRKPQDSLLDLIRSDIIKVGILHGIIGNIPGAELHKYRFLFADMVEALVDDDAP